MYDSKKSCGRRFSHGIAAFVSRLGRVQWIAANRSRSVSCSFNRFSHERKTFICFHKLHPWSANESDPRSPKEWKVARRRVRSSEKQTFQFFIENPFVSSSRRHPRNVTKPHLPARFPQIPDKSLPNPGCEQRVFGEIYQFTQKPRGGRERNRNIVRPK